MTTVLNKLFLNNLVIFCLLKRSQGKVEVNGTILSCESPTLMLDEAPELRHVLMNCHRKIRLSVTIYNTKIHPKNVEFLWIDLIYDPELRMVVRLSSPIVVLLKREPLLLAYPFNFETAVNAKAEEMVLSKQTRTNYTGCDDRSPTHSTCGIKTERGKIVPYSKGFCCSCKDAGESKTHPRGGQDCTRKATSEEEQDVYLTSAHCLHFDDTWYIVSALKPPVIKHSVYFQVFVRQEKRDETFSWIDMTKNQSFSVGSDKQFQYNDIKSVVATYITEEPRDSVISIDYNRLFLLIPEASPTMDYTSAPPAVKNGAPDFLLLPKEFVKVEGTECDKAGVSYEAFYKQKDRCQVPANTCLKNQPFDLWKEDDEKRKAGKNGSYLLSFYGAVNEDPILFNRTTKEHWLAFEHREPHVSVLYIEMDASSVVALRMGKYARLTQLTTISTNSDSKLFVMVTNIGLVPSHFSVKAVRCDEQIADSTEKSVLVPPQRSVMYELYISFRSMQSDGVFTCIVQASSVQLGVVAMREVTMKVGHRCVCVYHCQCNCFADAMSSVCTTMDEDSFHLAGFKGSLPVLHRRRGLALFSLFSLFLLLLFLLAMGFIKGILGLYYHRAFEEFGLTSIIYQRKTLNSYVEAELKSKPVEYDEEAYPVYPGTEERARVICEGMIFYLNVVFFLIFPLLLFLACLRKCTRESFEYSPLAALDESTQYDGEIQEPTLREEITLKAYKPESYPIHSKPEISMQPKNHATVSAEPTRHFAADEPEYPVLRDSTRHPIESTENQRTDKKYDYLSEFSGRSSISKTTDNTATKQKSYRTHAPHEVSDQSRSETVKGPYRSTATSSTERGSFTTASTENTKYGYSESRSRKSSEYTYYSKDLNAEDARSTETFASSEEESSEETEDSTESTASEAAEEEEEVRVNIAVDTDRT